LEELKPHRIYLGGYEPTFDPDLIMIIESITKLGTHIVLMTNGSKIDTEYAKELKKAGVNEIIIGIKAFDAEKHLHYTKRSNEQVLTAIKNLATIEDAYFRLQIETVLIPGINDPVDIECLAMFVSQIDPSISLFIEPWIPLEAWSLKNP